MRIMMDLDIDNINPLCSICDSYDFDTNIVCGIKCVDGKSTLGVMEMCGHTVEIVPVTNSIEEIEQFYKKLEALGAYKESL